MLNGRCVRLVTHFVYDYFMHEHFSIIIFKFAFLETVYFGEPEEKELSKI